MKLTEKKLRSLRPREKPYKVFDGGGLFILVTARGSKLWRYKFRFGGREQLLALGKYPDLSLTEVRRCHLKARGLLSQGINPAKEKRRAKQSICQAVQNTLEKLVTEWIELHSKRVVPDRGRALLRALERHCLPFLGQHTIQSLNAPLLLEWLHHLESKAGNATVGLCRSALKMVLDLAVARGLIEANPLVHRGIFRQLRPHRIRHHPAPDRPEAVASVLRAIDALPLRWSIQMRCALRLLPLIATRPSEMLHMKWADVDWKNKEWRFTMSKTNTPLIVPLARQSLEILKALQAHTGGEIYAFSARASWESPSNPRAFPRPCPKSPEFCREASSHTAGVRSFRRWDRKNVDFVWNGLKCS